MKTILITDEKDRAANYHDEEPDANQFSTYVINAVEMAEMWVHVMPSGNKTMKSRNQESLEQIIYLLSNKGH